MMTVTQCPTADRLKAYSLGRLSESETDGLFEHLRHCPSCQAELETVDDADDSLISELRIPDDQEGLLEEPDCKRAMAKALGALASVDELSESGLHTLPRTLGEYQIVRLLGRGGMGKVFLARHTKLGRHVALKILSGNRLLDQRMRERFDAEMRAIGQLSHPNIVTAHDARDVEGTAVLVTEFIDGMDLGEVVAKVGPLPIADACEIVCKVAAALQYTSDQGFVHRDVKPSNIMISHTGEVKLLDLGLARYQFAQEGELTGAGLTGTGQAIGTADYVSPEQVTDGRDVDCRSDIYSLGCTLFKLLTGNAPFADASHQTAFAKMTAQVSEAPPSLGDRLPECPPALVRLVDAMLAKDPAKRPQTSGEVARQLSAWTGGHDLVALVANAASSETQTRPLPPTTSTRIKPWHRRSVPITIAIAAGLMGVLLGLLMGMFLKITYPDGTVVQLPVGGATVEFVQQDSSAALKEPNKTASEGPLDILGVQPNQTLENQETDLSRLQGLWKLESPGTENSADPMTCVVSFEGTTFFSVAMRGTLAPHVSHGVIESMQRDSRGLTMVLREKPTVRPINVEVAFIGEDKAVFGFDPFAQVKTNPMIGSTPYSSSQWKFEFRRLGEMPTSLADLQSLLGPNPLDPATPVMRAIGMVLQAKTMGAEQFVENSAKVRAEIYLTKSRNNLKQFGLAFHNFHDVYRKLPASSNRKEGAGNRNNQPIQPFSWRVAILPFVEQVSLFEKYRFDEPWDSANNLKLLDEMPEIFRSPRADSEQPPGHTNYLGYATGQSALGTDQGVAFSDIRDGTSHTLMLVETKDSVPWTKPEDFSSDSQGTFFKPMLYLMVDASVHTTNALGQELQRILITRDGGEPIPR